MSYSNTIEISKISKKSTLYLSILRGCLNMALAPAAQCCCKQKLRVAIKWNKNNACSASAGYQLTYINVSFAYIYSVDGAARRSAI